VRTRPSTRPSFTLNTLIRKRDRALERVVKAWNSGYIDEPALDALALAQTAATLKFVAETCDLLGT
jgi:hypothetical protein